jgi:DNA-binding transcriptional regulator YdaS (Cro superfamily)
VRDAGVQLAIRAAGGVRPLARGLGIQSSSIAQWKYVPSRRVVQVEALTGIPRETLRPDLYRGQPRNKDANMTNLVNKAQEQLLERAEAAIRHIDAMNARAAETYKAEIAVLDAILAAIDAIIKPKEATK